MSGGGASARPAGSGACPSAAESSPLNSKETPTSDRLRPSASRRATDSRISAINCSTSISSVSIILCPGVGSRMRAHRRFGAHGQPPRRHTRVEVGNALAQRGAHDAEVDAVVYPVEADGARAVDGRGQRELARAEPAVEAEGRLDNLAGANCAK